ncbi:Hypothetical predicted protein [Lecanosticta acicola]|uniref:BZIP transcription factor n=1 Tax=Lecanosticta acicola TaxID=111012 RepID=A0AAI9EEJ4_9PEZI|nr:Hypothetical predicted protein [Lecanosticta acicola]
MSGRTGGGGSKRGGGVEKPWASGRILTPEQRARKQEADRKANRFLKKEVQDRLTGLEARVLSLEKTSSEPNTAIPKSEDNEDAHYAASAVSDPPDAGDRQPSGSAVEWNESGTCVKNSEVKPWSEVLRQGEAQDGAQLGSDNGELELLPTPSMTSPRGAYFTDNNAATTPAIPANFEPREGADVHETIGEPARQSVAPDFTDVTSTARTRPDGRHLTCFLNNLVNYIRTLPPNVVCFDDQYNQDLIVTAVLKGWNQTLARYHQACPLWNVLRLVDTYLFRDCQMVERISCLRMLHRRYLYEVNANLPTAGPPPPWFRPQFSEKVFFHDPVIDHLTWPRLRDRLIASEKDRLTNKFWAFFVRNLRVTWRGEPFDILTLSPDTQLYQLNPVYEASLLDMTNWRMDMDFFRGIPQLAGDVPPHNYMPLRTVAPKFGVHGHHAGEHVQPTMSPRFGLHGDPQQQGTPTHAGGVISQDPWVHRPGFSDASHLHLSKFPQGGVWHDFYC